MSLSSFPVLWPVCFWVRRRLEASRTRLLGRRWCADGGPERGSDAGQNLDLNLLKRSLVNGLVESVLPADLVEVLNGGVSVVAGISVRMLFVDASKMVLLDFRRSHGSVDIVGG